ncbi:alanine racemase [Brevibacterium litoralis]|uniref:alanine racemase n=1 Tax=Brevibacterium litoralis TaxID=3138935 RepID=UPI0032EBB9E5
MPQPHPSTLVRARIDLGAIEHNVRTLAARVAPARLMSVVKADAYGHGLLPVVDACRAAGVTDLGVATVPEALTLTDHLGVDPDTRAERVLCWLHDPDTDLTECVARGVELGIGAPEALPGLVTAARSAGRTARIHLKVDTGLGRNGLTPDQLGAVLDGLTVSDGPTAAGMPGQGASAAESGDGTTHVQVVGVMTHLAVADETDHPVTDEQVRALDVAADRVRVALEAAGGVLGDPAALEVHCANSPAALSLDPVPGTMARVGLSTYGLSPFAGVAPAELGLVPALTLHSTVLAVKEAPAGHGASYGLVYRAPCDTRFALVAGGYADGIPRSSSTHGQVLIRGRRYRQVGKVAMDQVVVDLGAPLPDGSVASAEEIARVEVGDPVVLIGRGGDTGPSAEEWGDWSGTVNYEIVTRLGERVRREYVRSESEGVGR